MIHIKNQNCDLNHSQNDTELFYFLYHDLQQF